jgi:hypothetical protein
MAVTGKRWKKNPTNHEKNKFLLGGNFRDPLNLNSLSDEKVNKIFFIFYINAITNCSEVGVLLFVNTCLQALQRF